MKASIVSKLTRLVERLEEVTHLLASENATQDMDQYRRLTREHSELTPVVEAFNAWRQAQEDILTAEDMLSDPDLKMFAQAEIDDAKERSEALTLTLQKLLLPKDPNDDKNVIVSFWSNHEDWSFDQINSFFPPR